MRSRTRERTRDAGEKNPESGKARRKPRRSKSPGSPERGGSGEKGSTRNDQDRGGQGRSNRRSKGKGRRRSSSPGRRNQRSQPEVETAEFWGDPEKLPSRGDDIRITDDPSAVPRSLGTPPLPGQEAIAQHYFRAVYDRAVTTAGALAAAGGLIDPETLAEEIQH